MAVGSLSKVLERLRGVLGRRDAGADTDAQLWRRYVQQRDGAAFEALLRRHGPMVLGVCRRVLHNEHDAEDAFQATFLVLLRKARALRSPEAVGNWLYGVAHRTALHARDAAARRRRKEAELLPRAETPDDGRAELLAALDQELARLPDKHRAVLLHCDLEGKTRKEAARELGWPEGTVASRLARARRLLAKRLAGHGLVGGGPAALFAHHAPAPLPTAVAARTIKAAGRLAAGEAPKTLSAEAMNLAEEVLKTMSLNRLVRTSVLVLAAGTVAGTGLLLATALATAVGGPEKAGRSRPGPVQTAGVGTPAGQKAEAAQDPIPRADLCGEWQSPVNGAFESGWLVLRPDGTFRFENHDVALGWTTTVSGSWEWRSGRLALREEDRRQDGRPVAGREKMTEELAPVRKGGEWVLAGPGKAEFRKVKRAAQGLPPGPETPPEKTGLSASARAAKWAKDLAVLERKLHGAWSGQGPCDGDLTLRADGTYERRRHGPGGNNSAGTWDVRWDALPPTLVLACKTSDDPAYAGKTVAVKLIQLDDKTLAFTYPGSTTSRFARVKQ
jgi:RNA polymerase sigma factor (sigma-70 family)